MTDINDEPLWARILHALYERGMQKDSFDAYGKSEIARRRAIADYLNENAGDASQALRALKDQGLIEDFSTQHRRYGYTLTKKGFEVAHERSLQRREQELESRRDRRQHQVNRAIGFLTLGLVLIGFIQATIHALVGKNASLWEVNLTLFIGLLSLFLIGLLLHQADLLSSWQEIGR